MLRGDVFRYTEVKVWHKLTLLIIRLKKKNLPKVITVNSKLKMAPRRYFQKLEINPQGKKNQPRKWMNSGK